MSIIDHDVVRDPAEVAKEVSEGVLATEQMVLNVGPQHPATHGVFRLLATIDGEILVDADPIIGYMHRGYEKLVEARDYRQITNLVCRMDWLSSLHNELPMWMAVEKLMEIEVPPRAQYMRVIMAEMTRILNHLMFFASFGAELGAITPTFYAFREREDIQAAMEQATGGRMHFGFLRAGGLKEDVPRGFMAASLAGVRQVMARIDDYYNLLIGNEIFKQRTIGVGVLDKETAYNYGVSGPIARGSGIDFDVRKDEPYLVYDQFDFDVPTAPNGDCFDRFWVLLHEVYESAKIVEQAIEGIPSGPILGKAPRVIQAPEGEVYVRSENSLGELGYYLISDGDRRPYRLKIRTPSFNNVSVLPIVLKNTFVSDMIAILGSFFFVLGDIDR
ncbi:MAG: NADH-quinone oxidoreductase subunit [Actinomycetota bacterium]|jgi:NADH-quinone oxidoreductase subunit D|nr:NADH-quinone oxidoreductase subunit [Actinomycetota bacterium]